jgi:sec-independent protein translocase protein TatA
MYMDSVKLILKTSYVRFSCYLCFINLLTMTAFVLPLVIGAPQIILIVVVVLLLFGGKKITELMRGLGSGIKEFKNASKEDKTDTLEDKK